MNKSEAKAFSKYTGDISVRLSTTFLSPLSVPKVLAIVAEYSGPSRGLKFVILLTCLTQNEPIPLSYGEIGGFMGCSERMAQRIVANLLKDKKICVQGNGRQKNWYYLPSASYAHAGILQPCQQCGTRRTRLYTIERLCDACRRKKTFKAKLAAFRKESPGQPLPVQFAGAKMSRLFLEVSRELDDEGAAG